MPVLPWLIVLSALLGIVGARFESWPTAWAGLGLVLLLGLHAALASVGPSEE